jgi:hypothetical protein
MNELSTAGFRVMSRLLTEADLSNVRAAITDTIDRAARALRTSFESSQPDAPFDERLDRIAQRDRAYAFALFHAVMSDAQRDARIAGLAEHPRLASIFTEAVAPDAVTGSVVRTRAVVPSLTAHRRAWHQDVIDARDDGRSCGSVRVACWIPLSDVDEHTGALELLRGSWRPMPHRNDDGHFSIPADSLPSGTRSIISLRCGDVLLLDRFVPHRALPTSPPHVRWAVVLWIKASKHVDGD